MRKLKNQSRTPTPKFSRQVATLIDKCDYSWPETQGILKFFDIPEQEFSEWIEGQTCPILPSGNMGFFHYDVFRFVQWKVKGVIPIWD